MRLEKRTVHILSTMKRLTCLCVCLLAVDSAFGATITRAPDEICKNADMFGLIEIGCWGYRECVNGAYIEHKCADNQFLDKNTRTCYEKGTKQTGCDIHTDCTLLKDGLYSDLSYQCKVFSQCLGAENIAHFYCPGDLVFNEVIQGCDVLTDVFPPCGTKLPETTVRAP